MKFLSEPLVVFMGPVCDRCPLWPDRCPVDPVDRYIDSLTGEVCPVWEKRRTQVGNPII